MRHRWPALSGRHQRSWWVNLFGHRHPHAKAALAEQLEPLDHVMLAGFTHVPVVPLSERLGAFTGLGHAFYGSDGVAATEITLKMKSAHHWRNIGRPAKNCFVGLAGGYHAETVGALAVDRHRAISRRLRPAGALGRHRAQS